MKIAPVCASVFVVGLLVSACKGLVQEINPDKLIRASPKLVVACFISPQDTLLVAKITQNNTVLGDTTTLAASVPDARVTLTESGKSIQLTYNAAEALYQASTRPFPIIAGRTYALTVATPDGRTATATATVPLRVAITEAHLDSTLTTSSTTVTKTFFVTFRWKDPAGTANFYRVAGTFAHAPTSATSVASDTTTLETINFRDTQNRRSLYSDDGADGNDFTTPNGRINQSITANQSTPEGRAKLTGFSLPVLFRLARFEVELLNTDQTYYQYYKALEQFQNTNGNPFAEPVLVPTNIQNGLGCFAAYNRSSRLLTVK